MAILPLAKPQEFLESAVLYAPFQAPLETVLELIDYAGHLDLYCIQCGMDSVFKPSDRGAPIALMASRPIPTSERVGFAIEQGTHTKRFACTRNRLHPASVTFVVLAPNTVVKVGQYPSREDRSRAEARKYRSLGIDHDELTRASGLAAHGIGIGAFVYLRRIFERQMSAAAAKKTAAETSWDTTAWGALRVEDKIKALAGYLPAFLVENRTLYGILSKGLHELAEEDCARHFPAVDLAIRMILDEVLAAREAKEKQEEAKRALSKIQSEVSSKK